MKRITLVGALLMLAMTSPAQENDNTSLKPFKIQETHLSGLDIPQQKLKTHPEREYFQKKLYKGDELSIYVLSSETATNEIENFPIDEFVYYLNGRADIKAENGNEISFFSGDYIFVPKGFSGTWINNGGPKYHLELSVISNNRQPNDRKAEHKLPFLLNREALSGIGLIKQNDGDYSKTLYKGVELEVKVIAQNAKIIQLLHGKREEFIHVLNGKIILTSGDGQKYIFYSGDFFVLPKNFQGTWTAESNGKLRFLKVYKV